MNSEDDLLTPKKIRDIIFTIDVNKVCSTINLNFSKKIIIDGLSQFYILPKDYKTNLLNGAKILGIEKIIEKDLKFQPYFHFLTKKNEVYSEVLRKIRTDSISNYADLSKFSFKKVFKNYDEFQKLYTGAEEYIINSNSKILGLNLILNHYSSLEKLKFN